MELTLRSSNLFFSKNAVVSRSIAGVILSLKKPSVSLPAAVMVYCVLPVSYTHLVVLRDGEKVGEITDNLTQEHVMQAIAGGGTNE